MKRLVWTLLVLTACADTRERRRDDDDDDGRGQASAGGGQAAVSSSSASVSTSSSGPTGAGGAASGAGSGGAPGGSGGAGAFDPLSCTGPASTSGTVAGVTPNVVLGYGWADPAGALALELAPNASPGGGDITVDVFFFPSPGQLDYSPNGSIGCAIIEYAGGSWSAVDTTQLCELHLTTFTFASAPGACDGEISGSFMGVFSNNDPLGGSFHLPLHVAASEVKPPGCQPYDGPCSSHDDCCSGSCSIFIGVCN